MHDTLWYISLPSLHDYNLKFPNFTFYVGSQNAYTNTDFFLFHSKLGFGPRIQLPGKLPTFAINVRKFRVTFSLLSGVVLLKALQ